MREIEKIPEESSNTREMKAYHQVLQEWGGQYPRSQEEGQPPSGGKKNPTNQTNQNNNNKTLDMGTGLERVSGLLDRLGEVGEGIQPGMR